MLLLVELGGEEGRERFWRGLTVGPDIVTVTLSTAVETSVAVLTSLVVVIMVLNCVKVWNTIVETVFVITGVVTRQWHTLEITESS